MRNIFLLMIFAYATPSVADNPLVQIAPINPEHRETWSARAEYHPYGKVIKGLPVHSINKQWCMANLLTRSDLPSDIQIEVKDELFVVDDLESPTGSKMIASVGVAQDCKNKQPKFFILLTGSTKTGKSKVIFVNQINEKVEIVALNKIDAKSLRVGWCYGCDNTSILSWENGKFLWLPDEEPGE